MTDTEIPCKIKDLYIAHMEKFFPCSCHVFHNPAMSVLSSDVNFTLQIPIYGGF